MTYWFWHPQTRRFLLLTPHEQRYRASFYDADGEPDWLTQLGDLDDLLSAAEQSGYVKMERRPGGQHNGTTTRDVAAGAMHDLPPA